MSNDNMNGAEVPQIDPVDFMRGQMVMALRDVERRFEGANVTVIVSAPDAARQGVHAQFSYATTAPPPDLVCILAGLQKEIGK